MWNAITETPFTIGMECTAGRLYIRIAHAMNLSIYFTLGNSNSSNYIPRTCAERYFRGTGRWVPVLTISVGQILLCHSFPTPSPPAIDATTTFGYHLHDVLLLSSGYLRGS